MSTPRTHQLIRTKTPVYFKKQIMCAEKCKDTSRVNTMCYNRHILQEILSGPHVNILNGIIMHSHDYVLFGRSCFNHESQPRSLWCDLGWISRKLHAWHFQFSIWLKCPFEEVYFAENPIWICPVVLRLWGFEGFSEQ